MRRHRVLILAALAAILVAGACSSGTGTQATTTTPSSRSGSSSVTSSPTTSRGSPATTAGGTSAATSGSWTTYFHDAGRSGVAPDGPSTPAAVRRVWATALDGAVYAQPLVVDDTVIAATENDTMYAVNAASGALLWQNHLGTPLPNSTLACGDVDPVGITGTPVADPDANRVFAVGLVAPGKDILYELNLATGVLVASTDVDPPGSSYTTDNQRAALALDGNEVLVPFGGRYGDCGSYHGRVTAVPVAAAGLGTPSYFTLPTENEGGFWAPPGAVVAPDGSFYLASGNSSSTGSYDYGNAVVHLSAGLQLLDSFAPTDFARLNASDTDLGSTNPVLDGSVIFQVGKSGIGYLLNAGHLGGVGGQLSSAQVCTDLAMGGVSHSGATLFVPCPSGLVGVSIAGNQIRVLWTAPADTAGPAIVTPSAVWTVATGAGQLLAVDPADGHVVFRQSIGTVPSRFVSPAAGSGRVVIAASGQVMAFGD
ncbi:MAG: PQQ-binding-like beta-propeller repeat protein [Acidimicrobiales bacterium]